MTRRRALGARRKRRGGFTLIEVVVSLGIMTIGAMAIISLQAHAIRANTHARQLTTAMQVAQRWVERMKQDSHSWNNVATPDTVGFELAATLYLRRVLDTPNVYADFPGGSVNAGASSAFDFLGNDVPLDATDFDERVFYCVAYRPAWVYFGRAMRVDVRVFWPRAGTGRVLSEDFPACNAGANVTHADLEPGGDVFDAYHVVYLPSVIRVQELTR